MHKLMSGGRGGMLNNLLHCMHKETTYLRSHSRGIRVPGTTFLATSGAANAAGAAAGSVQHRSKRGLGVFSLGAGARTS